MEKSSSFLLFFKRLNKKGSSSSSSSSRSESERSTSSGSGSGGSSWRWKLRSSAALRWKKRFNLHLWFIDDVLFKFVSAFEAVCLVSGSASSSAADAISDFDFFLLPFSN
ncbi:hypothetical protein SASPL_148243 [Salvia splendens]|uniref:Uncharacterized protein n=1 Tax=Salvia splendens TaxID=180675 RepID=A0A8X8Z371_SALSN|nr:hypothetical protein SASPL_148243 [Salvia splendens]